MSASVIAGAVRVAKYPAGMKSCSRCEQTLPVDAFGTFRSSLPRETVIYRCSQCRECHKITSREINEGRGNGPRPDNRTPAREMRAEGATYLEIGRRLGITGNAAWRLAHDVVIPEAAPEPVAPKSVAPAPLRVVQPPPPRPALDEQAASDKRARALGPVGECVCGALQRHHKGGKGSCRATNCPEYFERGA